MRFLLFQGYDDLNNRNVLLLLINSIFLDNTSGGEVARGLYSRRDAGGWEGGKGHSSGIERIQTHTCLMI